MATTAPLPPEVDDPRSLRVKRAVMEGLFLKAVPQSPQLLAALRGLGFDAADLRPAYSPLVFSACLEAARQQLHPDLTAAEGFHRLGVAQVQGLRATLQGKLLLPVLKLISAERLAGLLPTLFKVDRTPARITARRLEPRRWQIEFRGDPTMVPHYIGGVVWGLFEAAGWKPEVAVRPLAVGDFDAEVSWS